jgi:hypothetical protein
MSNPYYVRTGYPSPNAPGSSAALRAELDKIAAGFAKLPTLTGDPGKVIVVNSLGTSLVATSALQSLTLTGSTINSTPIGGTTPAAGTFTNLSASGTVSLGSSIIVGGGTINATPIGNVTPASGAFTTLSASLGITGALTGNVTGNLAGNVTGNVTGALTGNVTAASGTSTFNNVTINGTLDLNAGTAGTITGLDMPTLDSDAANKAYVDQVVQGLDAKASCVVATTTDISLSGSQTIDGIAVTAGQRVLVKNQTNASENGIYVAATGAWARASDVDTFEELVHAFTFVERGTEGANNGYVCSVISGGSLGATAVTWVQFSGAGQVVAGAGMSKIGNTLNVGTASAARIVVNADTLDLAATGITPGTYLSLTIDAYGRATAGTNPTTLAGYGITDAYTKGQIDSIFGSTESAAASASAAGVSEINAANSATAASDSASAASDSEDAAAASAAAAAASYDSFDDRYLGAKSSNPTVDNDGDPLLVGALYFNTVVGEMRVYDGAVWTAAGSTVNGTTKRQSFTATAGQTTFSVTGGYDAGFADVYLNGVKLVNGSEVTVTSGSDVVLAVGAGAGDSVDVVAYGVFLVANTYTKAEVDALAQTFTGISAPSTGWTGSGPYTNVITVTGLLATDSPIVDIDLSGVPYANVPDVQADWGLVYRVAATADNQLTLYALDEPTENFTVQVKVVR